MLILHVIIADDGPRTTIPGEDASRDESQNLPMIVYRSGDCLDPLGHIVHPTSMYSFPSKGGKGPMKSIPQRSKISTSRIGRIDISSRLEMIIAA